LVLRENKLEQGKEYNVLTLKLILLQSREVGVGGRSEAKVYMSRRHGKKEK
jgi:hypothetical protein